MAVGRVGTIGLVLWLTMPALGQSGPEERLPAPLPRVFSKAQPENVQDLKDIQTHVQRLFAKVAPLVVSLRIGTSQGSGVIISKDGYILTAAHVSGNAGQNVDVILHDGRKFKGKSLGANQAIDSGMVKLLEPGYWMHAEMGQSSDVKVGQWILTLGHPLGYQEGRPPVARLGRVLEAEKLYLRTDCPLVGGDSGGPLFDMHGHVVGIHSRIGKLLSANIHVPVDTYRDTWSRLVKGEVWGPNLFDQPSK